MFLSFHRASLVITNSSMNNDGIYEITVTNIIDRASKALTVYLTGLQLIIIIRYASQIHL